MACKTSAVKCCGNLLFSHDAIHVGFNSHEGNRSAGKHVDCVISKEPLTKNYEYSNFPPDPPG